MNMLEYDRSNCISDSIASVKHIVENNEDMIL